MNRNYNPRPVAQQSQMGQRPPMGQQMGQRPPMGQQMGQRPPMRQQRVGALGAEDQYIIYYSNYCINSKEFMNILCKSPLYVKFTKINVSEKKQQLPPFIKSVPTILVPNVQKPLVGEEVFKWLEEQSEKSVNNQVGGIVPYSPGEMGFTFGETYSYLDVKDVDQPMEHNFVFIKKGDQKIDTPAEDSFMDTKPKAVQEINRSNRPPFPQAPQRQAQPSQSAGGRPPMIPQSSGNGDGKNVDEAYNDLLARRKLDTPTPLPNP